jgi:simple sugar transport system ATP-binding protein
VAILLISEDLDEVLTLSDRIGVLYEGRLVGMTAANDAQIETIGLWMAGAST